MVGDVWFWAVLVIGAPTFWLLPERFRMTFLGVLSGAYLVRLDPISVLALGAWTVGVFVLAPHIRATRGRGVLTVAVLALLAYLAYFKYLPRLLAAVQSEAVVSVALPIGISYFTFKLIHYLVEVSRSNIQPHRFAEFAAYIFLMPIFTAGPIERFDHFLKARETSWLPTSTADGLTRISHGLIKKFVFGNLVLLPLLGSVRDGGDLIAQLADLPTWKVWAFCIRSFLYLYLDFSAYSDVAIGASRLFGLRIIENFNWPILAPNISEFWKRWHMSLAGWCQSYVYMPMVGLTRNPFIATYATFGAIAFWHSASVGWALWGLYHATGISIYGIWSRARRRRKWRALDRPGGRWVGIAATFAFVCAGASLTALDGHGGLYARVRVAAKLLFIDLPA